MWKERGEPISDRNVYVIDKLNIGFILSYMNEKEVKDWRELYLKEIEDPVTGKLVYLVPS